MLLTGEHRQKFQLHSCKTSWLDVRAWEMVVTLSSVKAIQCVPRHPADLQHILYSRKMFTYYDISLYDALLPRNQERGEGKVSCGAPPCATIATEKTSCHPHTHSNLHFCILLQHSTPPDCSLQATVGTAARRRSSSLWPGQLAVVPDSFFGLLQI